MTIDPKTLPEDTVVQVRQPDGVTTIGVTVEGGGVILARPNSYSHERDANVVSVFVPVPDGVAYDDALRAVNDARPWVPLPGGPTKAHIGRLVRLETDPALGATIVDRIVGIRSTGEVTFGACGNNWYASSGDWFVHPDDVPDPDADLIERIAVTIDSGIESWEPSGDITAHVDKIARAVLAVIREDQP